MFTEKIAHFMRKLMKCRCNHVSNRPPFLLVSLRDSLDGFLNQVVADERVSSLELDGKRSRGTFEDQIADSCQVLPRHRVARVAHSSAYLAVSTTMPTQKRGYDHMKGWAAQNRFPLCLDSGAHQSPNSWRFLITKDESSSCLGKKRQW